VSDLEPALALFTDGGAPGPRLRFAHGLELELELELVGEVLVLARPDEVLDAALDHPRRLGGEVLRGPAAQATGTNATVRMPFGAVVEYVEWTDEVRAQAGV